MFFAKEKYREGGLSRKISFRENKMKEKKTVFGKR
jgi:hypothetical protein